MPHSIASRILIVDDQREIHDTFDRVFADTEQRDTELTDFESRFFGTHEEANQVNHVTVNSGATFALSHANSGEEAVACIKAEPRAFSVAFVDMRMPNGMDGVETAQSLWKINPDLQVVICTAYSDRSWDEVLERLGQTDRLLLLKKPFESDEARQLAYALSEKSRLSKAQKKEVIELGLEVERRRTAEQRMQEMALKDSLTNLPNRQFLIEKLERLISNRTPRSPSSAVLFLDLDNFKIINDSLGHNAGDDLLNQVASRLKECVRDRDVTTRLVVDKKETVRLGGDEFVVLLDALANATDAIDVAERIVNRIAEPFELCERLVNVGTSVGVAYINEHTLDAQDVLRNADTAMYRAKNSGKGRVAVFDRSMYEEVLKRLDQQNELRVALENEQFELHYQPIINMHSATVEGVEVLLRWKDSSGNYVSPAEFIPVIEEIGLIQQVGEWVLDQAMMDYARVKRDLGGFAQENFYIGLNTSSRQLADPFFVDRLGVIAKRQKFDRSKLKVEINEGQDARHGDQVRQTLLDLQESGVGILIDDFGKGQSSLTCFQNYPIEAVKIDRSFMASIAKDRTHAVITEAIVGLAHHLNARIVAEGVESIDQLQSLVSWDCDAAQGYLFAPPMSASSLVEFLEHQADNEGIQKLKRLRASSHTPIPTLSLPQPCPVPVLP